MDDTDDIVESKQQKRLCESEQIRRMRRIPPIRFNVVSPYSNPITGISTGLTSADLNMRRKVEILKYSSNRVNSQTNNLTKKQKWSRIVSQPIRESKFISTESVCENDIQLRVPSTSSGIPGPLTYLWENPNVPLYNYKITRTYAYDVPNPNNYWDTSAYTNVGILNGDKQNIFVLSILQTINKPQYLYTIQVPIGIHIEGALRPNIPIPNEDFTVQVSTAIVRVKYHDSYVATTSNQLINNIQLQFNLSNMDISNRKFTATQYVGVLTFSGIELQTTPIYTFDFELQLNLTVLNSINIENYFGTTLTYYAYANITNDIITVSNCFIKYPPLNTIISDPTLVGV